MVGHQTDLVVSKHFNQVTTDPQREFFGFNTKTEKIINKAFNRFVEKELQKFKL